MFGCSAEAGASYAEGYTVVSYFANYDLATVLENSSALIVTIEEDVFPSLETAEIDGRETDDAYLSSIALGELHSGKSSSMQIHCSNFRTN